MAVGGKQGLNRVARDDKNKPLFSLGRDPKRVQFDTIRQAIQEAKTVSELDLAVRAKSQFFNSLDPDQRRSYELEENELDSLILLRRGGPEIRFG